MAIAEQPSAPLKNSSDAEPWIDDVLREVYAARDAYAAEHGNDLGRIFADLKRREMMSDLRLFRETE
jgi:hypothetical protein